MDISTNVLGYSIIACQATAILLLFFWIWKYRFTYLRGNPKNEFLAIAGLLVLSLTLMILQCLL